MYRIRQSLAAQSAAARSEIHLKRFNAWKGRWTGKTAVVLASGPSLTKQDVDEIRKKGWPTVVTNTTFRMAPWANVLFFHDPPWWRRYGKEVSEVFKGEIVTKAPITENNILTVRNIDFKVFGNSGAAAISWAIHAGAERIICLGLDCKVGPEGETHWHGSHPKGLGNAVSLPKWPVNFALLEEYAIENKSKVINASRDTSLSCFTRSNLEDLL